MNYLRSFAFIRGHSLWLWLLALGLLLTTFAQHAAADALDEIHKRGTLNWGGDQEGGGPYVFPDPKDPNHLIGFEVELAELLAGELGVKAKFQQGQWEEVPQMLDNQIDLALNGYERTPARLRDYLCTRPYYAFGLQMLAQRDGPLKSWKQLKVPKPDGSPWHIGVLGGSEADQYLQDLRDHEGYQVEVVSYNGNTDPMEHVQTGVLDATVADDCAANYYIDRFPKLNLIGWPVEGGYYVGLVSHDEPRLAEELNSALGKLISDGRLKTLYDRWNLDGRYQMLMLRGARSTAGRNVYLQRRPHAQPIHAAQGRRHDRVFVTRIIPAGNRHRHRRGNRPHVRPLDHRQAAGALRRSPPRHPANAATLRHFFPFAQDRLSPACHRGGHCWPGDQLLCVRVRNLPRRITGRPPRTNGSRPRPGHAPWPSDSPDHLAASV